VSDPSADAEKLFNDIPSELFLDPIEYLYVEHSRQRLACNLLQQQLEAKTPDPEIVTALKLYLSRDLGLHIVDEEENLFALLRSRARPEDELENLLQQLSVEHARDEKLSNEMIGALDKMIAGEALSKRSNAYKTIAEFVTAERRHLALENGALLPIARLRLTAKDLVNLGERMAARRGIDLKKIPV
jgi:hemerythrin-like domain-containing protein